jgi:hypothetical protein
MKVIKFVIFAFCLLFSSACFAKSEFKIFSWQENTNLTASGKDSEIFVQGQVQNLQQNQVITNFQISFDGKRSIKINKVICDGIETNFSFSNNALKIEFARHKPNKAPISIYFSYQETYDEINQFLRQEVISIPAFAVGAQAKVAINFSQFLESATLNTHIQKIGNSFTYSNIVPLDGVLEIIKLTAAQNVWDVLINAKVDSNRPLKNAKIILPRYFENGGQKVENSTTKINVASLQQKAQNNQKIFKLQNSANQILVQNAARIYTGKKNRVLFDRQPENYLEISSQDANLLASILQKILQNPKYQDLPLHAKIGEFVHEFIKYDRSYIGKLPQLAEILQNQIGVCTEYAQLYNALARLAKIPSFIVHGGACGEYKKCEGHAWNVIYVDGKWIEVDPTWNLFSGIVSSSHIYFSDSKKPGIEVEYVDEQQNVSSQVDFEMTQVL